MELPIPPSISEIIVDLVVMRFDETGVSVGEFIDVVDIDGTDMGELIEVDDLDGTELEIREATWLGCLPKKHRG